MPAPLRLLATPAKPGKQGKIFHQGRPRLSKVFFIKYL
jgi:hypothetical protein